MPDLSALCPSDVVPPWLLPFRANSKMVTFFRPTFWIFAVLWPRPRTLESSHQLPTSPCLFVRCFFFFFFFLFLWGGFVWGFFGFFYFIRCFASLPFLPFSPPLDEPLPRFALLIALAPNVCGTFRFTSIFLVRE